jgi:hypothetical protein
LTVVRADGATLVVRSQSTRPGSFGVTVPVTTYPPVLARRTAIRTRLVTVVVTDCDVMPAAAARRTVVSAIGTRAEYEPSAFVIARVVAVLVARRLIVTATPAAAPITRPLTVAVPPPVSFLGALIVTPVTPATGTLGVVVVPPPGVVVVGVPPPVAGQPTTYSAPNDASSGDVPPGARSTHVGVPALMPSYVSTYGSTIRPPNATPGTSIVTVPFVAVSTAPVVLPALVNPNPPLYVP